MDNTIRINSAIFRDAVILDGVTVYSDGINLDSYKCNGYFSIQTNTVGGTAKIQYEVSNNGVDWLTPDGVDDILSAATGKQITSFAPMVARGIRFKITASGDITEFTAHLAIQ